MKVLCSIVVLLVAQAMGMNVPKSGIAPYSGSEGRVVNGQEAVPNEYPWVVWLSVSTGVSGYSCTGSLINSQWVLTAAHCQQNVRTTSVYLGAHNVRDTNEPHTIVTVQASGSFPHPEYNANTLKADVALIKLPSPVEFSSKIQPITLDASSETIDQYVGDTVVISGWGKISDESTGISNTLQKGTVRVITNAECANTYGSIIGSGKICTTGAASAGASGTCSGDSGSALFTQVPSGQTPIQIGVTSFVSSAGCESGNPDGFANVAYYRQWMDQTIAANS